MKDSAAPANFAIVEKIEAPLCEEAPSASSRMAHATQEWQVPYPGRDCSSREIDNRPSFPDNGSVPARSRNPAAYPFDA